MIRHHAALILEQNEARPAQRGCDLLPVMEGGVVVAERRMEAAYPDGGGVAELISELPTLQVRVDPTVLVYLKGQFEQRARVLAELRIQEYVEGAHIGALQPGFVGRVIADAYIEKAMQRNARAAAAPSGARVGQLRQLLLDTLQASLRLCLRLLLCLRLRLCLRLCGCGRGRRG